MELIYIIQLILLIKYIIKVAIIIFFKKLLENSDMFGKMEERDN